MDTGLTINKTIIINAPGNLVWDALVNPGKIRQYFTGAETITDWQVGGEIIFIHHYEGKVFTNKGTVLDYEINHLLRYTYWTAFSNTADEPENYTTITYALTPLAGATGLMLTQTNFKNETWYRALETGWDEVLYKIKEIAESN